MRMEKLFYETRPYLLLALGAVAFRSATSGLMTASSVLLIVTTLFVWGSRAHHRGYFANVRIRG